MKRLNWPRALINWEALHFNGNNQVNKHTHKWASSQVSIAKQTSRFGAICECGLVAVGPIRADKVPAWKQKMGLLNHVQTGEIKC